MTHARLRFTDEGFKWRRTPDGKENAAEAPALTELFAHENGPACFQILLCAPEPFAVSTGCAAWYSPFGHRRRFRLEIEAPGARVQTYIEDAVRDDDGSLCADVLLRATEKDYPDGGTAAVKVTLLLCPTWLPPE